MKDPFILNDKYNLLESWLIIFFNIISFISLKSFDIIIFLSLSYNVFLIFSK
jgi:hypothetical protein